MFLLHERTRKSLCRLGFVALCVLPTCAVALWAASRNGDGHRARCEGELSRLLGLKITLGDIEYPEPGVVRYTDFLLADPETDSPIASAAQLQVRTTDTAVAMSASKLKITVGAATALAELLHARLRDRTESGVASLRLALDELVVAGSSGEASLLNLRGRLEPTSEGQGAQLAFRTAEMSADAQPVAMTIVRSRDARIGFELDTHGAFQTAGDHFRPVVQLLRTLVTDSQVLVPMTPEAKELLGISP